MFDLNEQVSPFRRTLSGIDSVKLNAGDKLKIIAGEAELFNDKVPAGKQWQITMTLQIDET